jgi:hypothetical protein
VGCSSDVASLSATCNDQPCYAQALGSSCRCRYRTGSASERIRESVSHSHLCLSWIEKTRLRPSNRSRSLASYQRVGHQRGLRLLGLGQPKLVVVPGEHDESGCGQAPYRRLLARPRMGRDPGQDVGIRRSARARVVGRPRADEKTASRRPRTGRAASRADRPGRHELLAQRLNPIGDPSRDCQGCRPGRRDPDRYGGGSDGLRMASAMCESRTWEGAAASTAAPLTLSAQRNKLDALCNASSRLHS